MNLQSILLNSVYVSLVIQIITGVFDMFIIFTHNTKKLLLLKSLLFLEVIVQAIEGTFYAWMVTLFSSIKNVTPNRYFDWMITTPIMLFTLCIYLDYLRSEKHDEKEENEEKENEKKKTLDNFQNYTLEPIINAFSKNKNTLIPIFILNWMMLLLGYLGEIGIINNLTAVIYGFIPFIAYFIIIYNHYAKYTDLGKQLFYYFFIIWSIYGFAALMSYYWKNICFNVLDIFSKNFFGIFLAYILLQSRHT